MSEANLTNSKNLLDSANMVTGAVKADAEELRQQAVSLVASMALMTNVINQNVEVLAANGAPSTVINNIQNSDLGGIAKKLFDRNARLSNKEGEKLTSIASDIQSVTKDLDVSLTVTVESLIKQFTDTATNTHLTETRRRNDTRELIGVLDRNGVSSEADLSELITISQKTILSENDNKEILRISKDASSTARKSSKVIEGTLTEISGRFDTLQLTNEEMLVIQNKNDLTTALRETANEVSIGNSALLRESTGTALELVGIGGPLGQMLASAVTDKIVDGANFMGKQIAARVLELGATETTLSKVALVKAKIQNTRDRVLDTLLFRKRSKLDIKRDEKAASHFESIETDNLETSLIADKKGAKINERKTKLRESFRNKLAVIRDKIQARRIGKAVGKQSGKSSLLIPGMLGKILGRVTAVIAPVAGAVASVGASLLSGIASVGASLLPAAAVAAAGAAGYAVGSLIDKGLDSVTESITGGKNKTVGGAIYDFFHKEERDKIAKQDAELKVLYDKNHPAAATAKESPVKTSDVTSSGNDKSITPRTPGTPGTNTTGTPGTNTTGTPGTNTTGTPGTNTTETPGTNTTGTPGTNITGTPGTPGTNITGVPGTNTTGTPGTNTTGVPGTNTTGVPGTPGTNITGTPGTPGTNITGVPGTNTTGTPGTNTTGVPGTNTTGVPGTPGTNITGTPGTPGTNITGVPGTNTTGTPGTNTTGTPGTNTTGTPGTNTTGTPIGIFVTGGIGQQGTYSIGKQNTSVSASVNVSPSRNQNTVNQIDEAQKQNASLTGPQPSPAPIVNVAPTPVIMPPRDKKSSETKTTLDDVGLLVLQRTVG